jgi:hypothetical protein
MRNLVNNKKGSLQLSVNFLVMFILAIIMLALGMAFLYQIVNGLDPIKKGLDTKIEREIKTILLDTNQIVALPYYKIDVKRGKNALLGVGIKNNQTASSNFILETTCEKAFKNNINFDEISLISCGGWVYPPEAKNIEPLKFEIIEIPIVVPKNAEPGMYIFKLQAKNPSSNYGPRRTFIINVI